MQRACTIAAGVFLLAAWTSSTGALASENTPEKTAELLGQSIADFTLRDYRGHEHSLSDYADSEVIVILFLGTDCPMVKLYGPHLDELAKKYAPQGVTFLGINSNRQDPPTKIGAWALRHGVEFPILKDPRNEIADVFRAIRTPEVFILDKQRVVRYWGRINDQYSFASGVGYGRPKVTRHDLVEAVDELLAGREVSVPITVAKGCHIGRVPEIEPHGDITYSNQIARILQASCVECHREGQIAPFPLTNFEESVGWGEMIREVVHEERMPPWYANPAHGEFANDARMSDEEKQLIDQWVSNGMPEGDVSDLPEPRQFAEGWGIPEPDAVFYIADEPFEVPAEGVVEYQYFTVDPGFKEDKWVQAFEARPGNLSVVHHIICFIQDPKTHKRGLREGSGAQVGYAPGSPPRIYPEGIAMRIPAGSKLVFQMHYTPVGTPQLDRSSIGLVFADPSKVTHELKGGVCGTVAFEIPPNEADHVVTCKTRLRRDTTLISMLPHLHLRGTAFRYEAEYPDGTWEVLLDVPRYDFNWQLWYDVMEPKLLPKGTKLHCTAHFDNSADNVYNHDPNDTVRFGDQTWEEMMFGFYTAIVPRRAVEDTVASQQ